MQPSSSIIIDFSCNPIIHLLSIVIEHYHFSIRKHLLLSVLRRWNELVARASPSVKWARRLFTSGINSSTLCWLLISEFVLKCRSDVSLLIQISFSRCIHLMWAFCTGNRNRGLASNALIESDTTIFRTCCSSRFNKWSKHNQHALQNTILQTFLFSPPSALLALLVPHSKQSYWWMHMISWLNQLFSVSFTLLKLQACKAQSAKRARNDQKNKCVIQLLRNANCSSCFCHTDKSGALKLSWLQLLSLTQWLTECSRDVVNSLQLWNTS